MATSYWEHLFPSSWTFSDDISWKNFVISIAKSAASKVGSLYRAKQFLSTEGNSLPLQVFHLTMLWVLLSSLGRRFCWLSKFAWQGSTSWVLLCLLVWILCPIVVTSLFPCISWILFGWIIFCNSYRQNILESNTRFSQNCHRLTVDVPRLFMPTVLSHAPQSCGTPYLIIAFLTIVIFLFLNVICFLK